MGVPRVPDPEWVISVYGEPKPRSVSFKELFELKDKISSMTLLWNTHSFYVNVEEGYFIINGGRRLKPLPFESLEDKKILYARRNSMNVTVSGNDDLKQGDIIVTYLLGVHGKLGEEEKEI